MQKRLLDHAKGLKIIQDWSDEKMKHQEKVCGTCKWNSMEGRGKQSMTSSSTYTIHWFCNCSDSDYYGCDTEYNDSCEEWSDRN